MVARARALRLDHDGASASPAPTSGTTPTQNSASSAVCSESAPRAAIGADQERAAGGDEAADVVAEARARAAQAGGEQLGQVVGEAAEHAEHASGRSKKYMYSRVCGGRSRPKVARTASAGQRVVDREHLAAAQHLGGRDRQQRADQAAQVEAVGGLRLPALDQRQRRRASSPLVLAVACARPVDTIGMNALQLHQVMSAITAIANAADASAARIVGREQLARCAGGGAARPPRFQRSGSLTNSRTIERDRRRDQAAQEHVAPRRLGRALEEHARDLEVHERRQEQAHRRRRVEQRARLDAALLGHHLGHHGRAGRPLAADAQAGDDAEQRSAPRCWARRRSSAVPSAYSSIVSISVRVRPMRSATWPNRMPPAAQPSSRIDVSMPPQSSVAALAAGEPMASPSSVGTQLGAT